MFNSKIVKDALPLLCVGDVLNFFATSTEVFIFAFIYLFSGQEF